MKYLGDHKCDAVFKFLSHSCCICFPVDALPPLGRLLRNFCPKSPVAPHCKMLLSSAPGSLHIPPPAPADFHLHPPPTGMSPCPSPTPFFQQLYHAVAYMERELNESPSHMCSSPHPDSLQHDLKTINAFCYADSPVHFASDSMHATECSTVQVSVPSSCKGSYSPQVTVVPSPHHTDLDDISQPDVGGGGDHLSGAEQGSMSESESEGSIKKEGLHDAEGEPLETPYVHRDEVEEFGSVIICYSIFITLLG